MINEIGNDKSLSINFISDFRASLSAGVQEIQELYQYRPPAYDIAVGIFRISVIGLLCKPCIDSEFMLLKILGSAFSTFTAYKETFNLIRWSKLYKISKDQSNSNVVLICRPTADPTGATYSVSSSKIEYLKELRKKNSIVICKVDTVNDINKQIDYIKNQNRTIKTLLITAHGDPDQIALGKELIIGKDPVRGLLADVVPRICADKIHFENLDPEADIVLESCSTGGKPGIVDGLNIAEWFQLYAGPKRRVFAARTYMPYNGTKLLVGLDNAIKYQFSSLFGYDISSDISYEKIIEKLKSEHLLPNSWKTKVCSIFKQYRSFDYKNLLQELRPAS